MSLDHIDALTLVILAFATWRLSEMVAMEGGPGDVFAKLRVFAGAWYSLGVGWQSSTFFGKLIICPLCLSVWFAAFIAILLYLAPWTWPGIVVLAISGISSSVTLYIHGSISIRS